MPENALSSLTIPDKAGACMVLVTCATPEQAKVLAKTLVTEQLAACVNIIPGIQSVYRWQDEVIEETECLLLIKTQYGPNNAHLAKLIERIQALHSYSVPEVLAVPITAGSTSYLAWLIGQLS